MKTKVIFFILASVIIGVCFQNCGQASGHIEQEEIGQVNFVDKGCLEGRMCLDESDKECVNDPEWYQFDEKTVCPKEP